MNNSPLKHNDSEATICHTCKSSIDELPFRFLIVKDRFFQKHDFLSFHYFFPCWDVDYIFKNLGDFEIFKAGYRCDESILKNPKAIENLKRNEDLWDIEVIT